MSVWPAWEVREDGGATAWLQVRLAFPDGAGVEALAVLADGNVSLEDVRARPALSLDDLVELADWIEGPLFEACGIASETVEDDGAGEGDAESEDGCAGAGVGARRARPPFPRGIQGRWLVAQEYRAAQAEGADPVLAVMCATGHSRRKSLRLIAQARDAGFLAPRHARRT
ncbi:DUF6214 family protein [Streptomyces sp.]|uniref:DUF6214 family protein n=1 Tax=Streptomyces sp. TaxID=1931 RepID=UPI002D3F5E22|nr:DUF6214 family protein [Streptomyces sp.]HZF89324.1 DUF6214 family protein [Streptomyces sp.]